MRVAGGEGVVEKGWEMGGVVRLRARWVVEVWRVRRAKLGRRKRRRIVEAGSGGGIAVGVDVVV